MGGGGFLYDMNKSLEGNRALLKKGGFFNNANEHEVSPGKTLYEFKKASKKQLLFYRSLTSTERQRQTKKALILGAVLLTITVVVVSTLFVAGIFLDGVLAV